jgi:hypothetical protein
MEIINHLFLFVLITTNKNILTTLLIIITFPQLAIH